MADSLAFKKYLKESLKNQPQILRVELTAKFASRINRKICE
jgi:hypothetical protein